MPLEPSRLQTLHARYPKRRAVITGAGSGLGKALSLELARHGWTLLLNDNDADRLEAVVGRCRIEGGRVLDALHDVAELSSYRSFAEPFLREHGGVDLVFATAGIGLGGSFLEAEPADLHEIVAVNLLGTMWTAKTYLPVMVAAGRGHFIAVASAAAFHGLPRIAAYAATKAGVVQLSETLRSELKASGVDVTVKMTTFYTSNIAEFTRGPAADREKARSLVEMAPWSAEQVADALLLGVQARRFYMVAPGQARFLWRFKRFAPETYLRLVPALFPRLETKLLAAAERRKAAR